MLLMTQRMVTWLKINVEDVEKENKQLIHQCFVLETEECSLDDLSVIAAISHLAGETRQCGGISTSQLTHLLSPFFCSITTKRPSDQRSGKLVVQGKFLCRRPAREVIR